jgi:hypothetical protein
MVTNEDLDAKKKDLILKQTELVLREEDLKIKTKELEIKNVEVQIREADLNIRKKENKSKLEIKRKNRGCFTIPVIVILFIFSLALLGICVLVFFGASWGITFDWIRLITLSMLTLSFTVLITFLTKLLKTLVSQYDEE